MIGKELVHRFYDEVVNQGNIALLDELMAPDYVEYGNPTGSGSNGFKQFAAGLVAAFPDLNVTVEDIMANGNKVVARVTVRGTHLGTFMGNIPATGRKVVFTGIDIFEITDARIAARWNQRDLLGLVRQLGAFPAPE